jgi:hypothetical protein
MLRFEGLDLAVDLRPDRAILASFGSCRPRTSALLIIVAQMGLNPVRTAYLAWFQDVGIGRCVCHAENHTLKAHMCKELHVLISKCDNRM